MCQAFNDVILLKIPSILSHSSIKNILWWDEDTVGGQQQPVLFGETMGRLRCSQQPQKQIYPLQRPNVEHQQRWAAATYLYLKAQLPLQ